MALLPNDVFERTQFGAGRQMTEQTQQLANAGRANTPAQAQVAQRGNRPPSTPGFLVDGIRGATPNPPQVPNTGSQGLGLGAALTDLGQRFAQSQASAPPQPPSTVGATGLNPTRRGMPGGAGVDFHRQLTIGGDQTPQTPPAPQASGGPGVAAGAANPTTRQQQAEWAPPPINRMDPTPGNPDPQVNTNALQGAVQAGGSATDMGYWQGEGGPRNYVPGTQANGPGAGLSVMPMGGGAPGAGFNAPMPQGQNVGGSGANGTYRAGVDPMYMDPNRGAQTAPLMMGGGAGGGGFESAADAYLNASPGGGAEGSRRRQQLRAVMEAQAGIDRTDTQAGATVQSAGIGADSRLGVAGIGADTTLQQTGMQQEGQDRRTGAELGLRQQMGAADIGVRQAGLELDRERFEAGQGMDPFDAQRLQMSQIATEMGLPFETVYNIIRGESITPEPYTLDAGTQIVGEMTPQGLGAMTPTMQLLLEQAQTRR